MRWLRKKPISADEAEILNYALGLAIQHYLQPMRDPLHERFPLLTEAELERYIRTSRAIAKAGIDEVYRLVMQKGTSLKVEDLKPRMAARAEWISDDNILRLITFGIYMAVR